MTEAVTDNFDEALGNEDNPDEAGTDITDETPDDTEGEPDYSDPVAWLDTQDNVPDEVKQAVKNGFLRRSDYSQKTQALAKKRDLVDEILLQREAGKDKPQPQVEEKPPPSLKEGATPEEVIDHYVQQAVQAKLEALGINNTVEQMKPLVDKQRVVDAYRDYASENPDQDHATLSAAVGQVLDTDPELEQLAITNPRAAVRAAARIASAELRVAKSRASKKRKRATAPASARASTSRVATGGKRLTPLEAATQALKEQGAL